MTKYLVTYCERDYRGERLVFSEAKDDAEINSMLGMLVRSYGAAKEVEPGYFIFKGSYQAAHGGQEGHGATLSIESLEEAFGA